MALTKISTAMISQSAAAVDLNVDAGTFYVDTTNNRVGVGGKTDPDTPLHVIGTATATTFAGSGASLTSIPNSALVNSSITINSTAVSLGGSLTLTTANIAENTNLYYTNARADARIAAADTDDLSEGSSNLYYTDARVDARVSGGSLGNITTTGYIRGPATFTIDPAAHGDNTGTVVIAGNLQVDGTQTVINSTTLTVDDKNITLASGSANAAAASGAGFTVDIGSGTNPAITYDGTNDEWDFNKPTHVEVAGARVAEFGRTGAGTFDLTISDVGAGAAQLWFQAQTNDTGFNFRPKSSSGTNTNALYIAPDGNVGINITNPSTKLHVGGIVQVVESSETAFYAGNYVRVFGSSQEYGFRNTGGATIANISMSGNSYFNGGNVGIGTDSPSALLHISGNSDVSDENCQLIIDDVDGSAGSRIPSIQFRSVTGGTTTNQGRIRSTDTQGMILSGSSAQGDDLVVQAGKVGIGTTSPGRQLEIFKAGGAGAYRLKVKGDTGHTGIEIESTASSNTNLLFRNPSHTQELYMDNAGKFHVYNTNVHRLTVQQDGKVGIGTISPPNPLSVRKTITGYEDVISIIAQNSPTDIMGALAYDQATDLMIIRNDQTFSTGGIAFRAGGTANHLFIKTGGNVGIGQTPGTHNKLVVKGTVVGTAANLAETAQLAILSLNYPRGNTNSGMHFGYANANYIQAADDSGANAKNLTLNPFGGNVGIATTSPDYTLEVVGDSMIGDASAVTSPAFGAQQQIVKSFTYGASGAGRNGNLYLLNTNTSGDAGLITFGGYYNNTNNLYYQTGGIGGGKETASGNNQWGGYLSFITTSDGSKGSASGMYEHMRITADGHIQIKQTGSAPTNGVMLPGHIEFKGQGWDSNSGSDDMNAKIEMAATYGKVGSGATSPELVFSLQGAGGLDSSSESYVEGMRLVGAGAYNNNQPRLGIGTTNPSKTLDVFTSVNTGGIQITGGSGATNTSLHISNAGSSGNNWNITSTGGGHGYGDGQLHFGIAYAVPKMRITSSGNVGIGHVTGAHTPQKVLEVEVPANDFATIGARTLAVGNFAGIHFGYKENNTSYRKSAIVFERTDLTSNNAQGKVHILNGPQGNAASATLADRALTINEDGSVELGRPNTLLTEDSYALQNHQILFKPHQSASDEAVEEKSACFSKIWRKSAILHPGQYSNGNYYVGIGVSSMSTSSYVVYKMNVVKCKQIYARAYAANSADGQTRTNVIYYSTDDINWNVLATGTWTAGGNTREGVLDTSTMSGAISGFYTGTIFIRCSILGGASGHTNLIGWNEFEFKARAQSMDLEGGGFGLSKNDLTLGGNANTGHGYTPLTHSYGHQYSGTNNAAIVASNSGTQTFATKGFGHEEKSIFQPVTVASIGANGLQIMKTGLLHCTFNQDIITVGSTSYAACQVRRYNEGLTNSVTVCSTLTTNTDGQWDMINGDFICDVVAGDILTFTYTASSISSMDTGTWSNYNFMLHPTAITSQGTAGTNLPWVHQ
jgi:hypothetical protein